MIAFYYANRAEYSILEPVINECARKKIEILDVDLSKKIPDIENDKNLSKVYDFVYNQLEENADIKSAVVIGDRREVTFAVMALFVKEVPVVQLAAGDLSEKICLVDDYFRHLITILSSKQVCFTGRSKVSSDRIKETLNLNTDSVYLANPTLSELDMDFVGSSNGHDLVLVHPQSLSRKDTKSDALLVKELLSNKKTIVIRGNKDKNHDVLDDLWKEAEEKYGIEIYDNLPKDKFVRLLASCDRFITNSSCSFYEAPVFLKESQIIRVGNRNKEREIANYSKSDLKSSEKIVEYILQ